MASLQKIGSWEKIEDEKDIPIEDYFANDSESSDDSSDDGTGGAGVSLTAGLEESELIKNPEALIDKSLTGLL